MSSWFLKLATEGEVELFTQWCGWAKSNDGEFSGGRFKVQLPMAMSSGHLGRWSYMLWTDTWEEYMDL